ncbi:glycosyltransferase [Rheinheimera sp. UJ63]|uniref:glycosyltransferase n=1 Tax=Rheinheimera sp. UJ63 TaxID=2910157 RepID=UPI001F281267|nr:glycosyltransferase [Rheinheimera sp. UJ63]MCF4009283.1 glycosyltransferase [Rheinheimera sp. UJ63]
MSNLHNGGAVQVATSFLREIVNLKNFFDSKDITILISTEVKINLSHSLQDIKSVYKIVELDVFGLGALLPSKRVIFSNFELIFTLFGPDYLPFIKSKKIVGFAQPWIIYNNTVLYQRLGFFSSIKTRLGFWIKKQFFKTADVYVVELEHVKNGMLSKGLGSKENIHIAYNCISRSYIELDNTLLYSGSLSKKKFTIGLISRNYFHKNICIIPEVKAVLLHKYGKDIDFCVTFNETEFNSHSDFFQQNVINLGPKSVDDCLDTYLSFDAVIFPSLLECFSATPLEALASCRVLFASDMPFNRDVCGEYAYYFNPLDPNDAAEVISKYIDDKWGRDLEERLAARMYAIKFSSPVDRALIYVDVINKVSL